MRSTNIVTLYNPGRLKQSATELPKTQKPKYVSGHDRQITPMDKEER